MRLEVDVLNWKPRVAKLEGHAMVDGKLACEATVMCALVPRTPEPAGSREPAADPGNQE